MKKFCLNILALFCMNIAYGQYSDNFIELTSNLSPIDSVLHEKHFGNGKMKEKGQFYVYNSEKHSYQIPYGEWIDFYRTGEVFSKTEYDNYGHIKSWNSYSKDGIVTWTTNLKSITTKAKNIDDFFTKSKLFDWELYEQRYEYSYDLCEWYLKSEGLTLNYSKVGTWKTYNYDGSLKKEKVH